MVVGKSRQSVPHSRGILTPPQPHCPRSPRVIQITTISEKRRKHDVVLLQGYPNSLICVVNLIIFHRKFNNLRRKFNNLRRKFKFFYILAEVFLYLHRGFLISAQRFYYICTTKSLYLLSLSGKCSPREDKYGVEREKKSFQVTLLRDNCVSLQCKDTFLRY